MKKNNILIVFTLLLLVVVSCSDDFLDKQPFGESSIQGFFNNEEEAVLALNAAYKSFYIFKHDLSTGNGFDSVGLMWSNNVVEHSDLTGLMGRMRLYNIQSDHGSLNGYWTRGYEAIFRCNLVIENVPLIEGTADSVKDGLVGEALFLRALYYHYLSMWFGGLPIIDNILDANDEGNFTLPRATMEETLAFINNDLTMAESRLPASNSVGRADRGAASSLLLKILLWQKDYSAALVKAQEIEGMGYQLVDDFGSLFDGTNENSSESIFEVEFDNVAGGLGSGLSLYYAPSSSGFVPNGGWAFIKPIQDLFDEYEPADSRRIETLLADGETFTRLNGDVIPFDNSLGSGGNTGFGSKKYVVDVDVPQHFLNYGPQNWHEIRYGEVILLYAEALLGNGQKDAAIAQINRVRARPSVDLPPLDPGTLTIEQAWDALYHEYRVELALEARFGYALRRWGIAADFYAEKGIGNFVPGKHEVLPLPQRQIDLSQNTLNQNPGY